MTSEHYIVKMASCTRFTLVETKINTRKRRKLRVHFSYQENKPVTALSPQVEPCSRYLSTSTFYSCYYFENCMFLNPLEIPLPVPLHLLHRMWAGKHARIQHIDAVVLQWLVRQQQLVQQWIAWQLVSSQQIRSNMWRVSVEAISSYQK